MNIVWIRYKCNINLYPLFHKFQIRSKKKNWNIDDLDLLNEDSLLQDVHAAAQGHDPREQHGEWNIGLHEEHLDRAWSASTTEDLPILYSR